MTKFSSKFVLAILVFAKVALLWQPFWIRLAPKGHQFQMCSDYSMKVLTKYVHWFVEYFANRDTNQKIGPHCWKRRAILWSDMFVIFLTVYEACLLLSPDEYKSKVVCEGEKMRLNCKPGMQIAVYSAMFGRTQQGTLECPPYYRRATSVGETFFNQFVRHFFCDVNCFFL